MICKDKKENNKEDRCIFSKPNFSSVRIDCKNGEEDDVEE